MDATPDSRLPLALLLDQIEPKFDHIRDYWLSHCDACREIGDLPILQ